MSPLAQFLIAAAVLHAACAASLPEQHSKPLSDITLEQEDTLDNGATPEDVSVVKDIENNLRVKPEDILVNVIIEDSQPAIKINEIVDDDKEIKRPSIDLRNPGPPQRQEHETQNADHFADVKLSSVQETILQTQDLLRQGVKGVGDDISNWLTTNEQMNAIQQNIQALRDSFTVQIQKLNEVIKGLSAPQALKQSEKPSDQGQAQPNFKEVQTRIKILENNFNNGVRALSEGVSIVSILRAEDENAEHAPAPAPAPAKPEQTQAPASTPTTSPPNQNNILFQFMNNFQHVMADSMKNVTTALTNAVNNVPGVSNLQNYWNPTTLAPGVLADTPDGTTQRPANNPWPNWQLPFQNFFSVPTAQADQAQTTSATPGPIVAGFQNIQTAIQNNPFVQNVIDFVRPGASSTNTGATGSNVVPQNPTDDKKPETPSAAVIAAAGPPAPTSSPTPAAPVGPIRQILSTNPVVQSIASTVQRIQGSINNPETPRDTEKSEDPEIKGGGNNNNNRPSDYGSTNVGSGLKPNAEPIKEDTISGEIKKSEVEEQKISKVVLEKTE